MGEDGECNPTSTRTRISRRLRGEEAEFHMGAYDYDSEFGQFPEKPMADEAKALWNYRHHYDSSTNQQVRSEDGRLK